MVDSISAVRSYVLSSVCIRILKSVVTHHNALSLGTEEEESVTLNWIAHCMIQGSNDNDAEVRKSALQICRILVEYSALGSEMNNAENQSLIKELYSYLPDTAPPVTTFSYDSLSSSSSGNTGEGSPGGGEDSKGREGDVIIPGMADVHIMFCRALPIISRLVEDKEVQIRSFVGSYCGEFCILMGGKWSMILLDVIFTCCRDPVMEVRVAGLTGMPHVIIAFLQDAILKLRHDSSCAIPPPAPPSSPSSAGTGTAPAVFRPLISVISALCSMYRDNNSEVKRSLCRVLSKTLSLFFSINSNNITSPHPVSSTNSNNITHTDTHTPPPTPAADATLTSLESSLSLTIIHLLTDPDPLILIEMMTQFELSLASEYLTGESSYVSLIFLPDHSRTLFNCLQVLSRNSNWRVRKLICALIPKFVLTLGSFDFHLTSSKPHPSSSSSSSTSITSTSFLEMVEKLIHDPVFDVRKAATRSLCLSALNLSMERSYDEMSQNWLDGVILPQLESLRLSRRYSERILGLHMISILLLEEVIHEEDVRYNILIQIALALARDPVANVRIALCEMLWNVAPLIRQHTISSVMTPIHPPLPSPTAASAGAPRGKETGLNGKQQSPSEDVKRYANEFYRIQSELLPVVQETLKSLLDDRDKDVCYSASKAMRCLESDGSAESPESNGEGQLPLILRRKQER
jgi:hypothetical protein